MWISHGIPKTQRLIDKSHSQTCPLPGTACNIWREIIQSWSIPFWVGTLVSKKRITRSAVRGKHTTRRGKGRNEKHAYVCILEKMSLIVFVLHFWINWTMGNRKLLIGNILYFFRSALSKSKREKNARRASGKIQPKTNMDTQNNHIWNEIHFKNHDFWFLSQIWGYSDSFSITMSIPSQNCLNACSMLFPTTIRLGPLQFIEKVAVSTPQTTSTAATEWSIRMFAIRDQNWMFESIHIWLGGCQNHATAGK